MDTIQQDVNVWCSVAASFGFQTRDDAWLYVRDCVNHLYMGRINPDVWPKVRTSFEAYYARQQ